MIYRQTAHTAIHFWTIKMVVFEAEFAKEICLFHTYLDIRQYNPRAEPSELVRELYLRVDYIEINTV